MRNSNVLTSDLIRTYVFKCIDEKTSYSNIKGYSQGRSKSIKKKLDGLKTGNKFSGRRRHGCYLPHAI